MSAASDATLAGSPDAQAEIEAELFAFSGMGLKPICTGDLRGQLKMTHYDQPALLINTHAHVSVLAGAATAMAQRLSAFAEILTLCTGDGFNMQNAVEAVANMASEVVALTDAVASHPSVMQASSRALDSA